jgi:hypothetical protein
LAVDRHRVGGHPAGDRPRTEGGSSAIPLDPESSMLRTICITSLLAVATLAISLPPRR